MKRILIFGLIILGILVNISAQDKIIPPTPLLPADTSSNLNVKFNIDWTSVSGAVSYELQLDTNSAFTAPVTIQTMYSAYTINNLMYGTTYYWRVRAKNATNQYSSWSDVWNFTTKGLVSLRKPLDSANHVPLKLAIKWDTISGSMYRIQVDTTANFNSTMLSEFSAITADSVSLNRLLYNQKYFWRVMAYHQNDSADWSLTRLFTTKSNLDITPKFPVNNYTDFIPGDVIKAYAIWGSNGGELLLSEDSSFDVQFYYAFDSTDIIITKIQNTPPKYDTTVNVTTGYLKFNQNCYWKMRFFHSSDTSEWSPVYKFKTLD
ncbi:MAG TPA: fibronectin type III domain-containing protein, partial [Bacteroidales bacterium]|nr:fibronectin type III domain-containing protein [Bacteroidales bacterium]